MIRLIRWLLNLKIVHAFFQAIEFSYINFCTTIFIYRYEASNLQQVPSEQLDKVGGKLFTFGSYRLGTHTRGSSFLILSSFYWFAHFQELISIPWPSPLATSIGPTSLVSSSKCSERLVLLQIFALWNFGGKPFWYKMKQVESRSLEDTSLRFRLFLISSILEVEIALQFRPN